MKKDKYLPFNALTKGYVLVPKSLLAYKFSRKDSSFSYLEAFLMVLTKVNYDDKEAKIKGETITCKRGESFLSFANWAKTLNWTIGKVRWFFRKMEEEKLVSITPLKYGLKSIRVIDFDLWTGKPSLISNMKVKNEDLFIQFWEKYHEITQLRKVDIGLARKEWNKLASKDKKAAINNIEDYCEIVGKRAFFKSAANYLRAKCFYDEGVDECV